MEVLYFTIGALAIILMLGMVGFIAYFFVMTGIFVVRVPKLLERIAEALERIARKP